VSSISESIVSGSLVVKVGDFGLCTSLQDPPGKYTEGENRYFAKELLLNTSTETSSVSWAEIFDLRAAETAKQRLSEPAAADPFAKTTKRIDLTKADIFSLGASIYELCKGRKLAGNSSEDSDNEWANIRNGQVSEVVMEKYSTEFKSLVVKVNLQFYAYNIFI
jgi:hypothetical protein